MTGPRTLMAVCPAPMVSGAEKSLLCLLRHLDRDRYRPLLACPDDSPLSRMAKAADIETVPVPALHLRRREPLRSIGRLRTFALTLSQEVKRRRPHLLHANGTPAMLGAMRSARKLRVPLIWHVRDVTLPRLMGRMAARRADATIAISRTVRDAIVPLCPDSRPPVTIYNGIDPDELAPSADRERTRCTLGIEDDRPVVLFAAQLVAWKRPDLALEVFAKVRARRGDAQLWIAGSPPPGDETAADKLKTQATVLGIADAIRLLGHRPDMPDLFRAADVLLATARTEPLGRSVMEAMALGRPVVATAGGGHLELIEDGNSGILFDADAPQSAADRLLELLDDTEKARRLGEAARHRIASNFTVETMVEGVQELYDRLP